MASQSDKQRVRQRHLRRRRGISPASRKRWDAAVARRTMTLPALRAASAVGVYVSHGSEVDTQGIIRSLLRRGVSVAVPAVVHRKGSMFFTRLERLEDLRPGAWGIPEVPGGARVEPGELDAVLIPGVAFDWAGGRMGRGAGCFDKWLARAPGGIIRIGLAYEAQMSRCVPRARHDQLMDLVVTERAVYRVRPG